MAETIGSSLRWAREYLAHHQPEEGFLDAEVLLAHVLGQSRAYLYGYSEKELSQQTYSQFRAMLEKRVEGVPVAYLTGMKEFMSLVFQVDNRVLIPRPETELLVELAIDTAKDLLDTTSREFLTIVDVGTGSGAIAVSGAKLLPALRFYAIDVSTGALEVARTNAQSMGVASRITFLQGDLLKPLENRTLSEPIDIILANLPYIPREDVAGLQKEVVLHEPHLALDGGDDGLELYRRLIPQASKLLRPGGALIMEIGWDQGDSAGELFKYGEWGHTKIIKDYAGKDRIIFAQKLKGEHR